MGIGVILLNGALRLTTKWPATASKSGPLPRNCTPVTPNAKRRIRRASHAVRPFVTLPKADLLSALGNGRVSLAESRFGFNLMKGDGRLWLTTLFRLRSGEPRSAQIGVPRHRSVNLMKRRFPALPCRSTPTSETRPLDEVLRTGRFQTYLFRRIKPHVRPFATADEVLSCTAYIQRSI